MTDTQTQTHRHTHRHITEYKIGCPRACASTHLSNANMDASCSSLLHPFSLCTHCSYRGPGGHGPGGDSVLERRRHAHAAGPPPERRPFRVCPSRTFTSSKQDALTATHPAATHLLVQSLQYEQVQAVTRHTRYHPHARRLLEPAGIASLPTRRQGDATGRPRTCLHLFFRRVGSSRRRRRALQRVRSPSPSCDAPAPHGRRRTRGCRVDRRVPSLGYPGARALACAVP